MTAPYYQDDVVTLFHGDCREITDWLAADVLVTDPPYGIRLQNAWKRSGDQRYSRVDGDNDTVVRDDAIALWGAERPALVFGRWDAPRPAGTHKRLIWDKGNNLGPGNTRLPWGYCDEEINVLGSWPLRTPGGRAAQGGTPTRVSNIVRVSAYHPSGRNRPDHPTPKPPELLVQLIERCPPGVIADPFAGSGATLLAARQLGRRVIGVEVEERYCELIAQRLAQDTLPFGEAS